MWKKSGWLTDNEKPGFSASTYYFRFRIAPAMGVLKDSPVPGFAFFSKRQSRPIHQVLALKSVIFEAGDGVPLAILRMVKAESIPSLFFD